MRLSQAKLKFLSETQDNFPDSIFLIGGLPRSGTSSCERFLHGFQRVFVADECHLINRASMMSEFRVLQQYGKDEIELWSAEDGSNWRSMRLSEYDDSQSNWMLALLFLFTRPTKYDRKNAAEIRRLGFKLPSVENTAFDFLGLYPHPDNLLIYCVREPTRVLTSNWEMPWTKTNDQAEFIANIAAMYALSLTSYTRLESEGVRCLVWKTPTTKSEETDHQSALAHELSGLFDLGDSSFHEQLFVDEWPAQCRRAVDPLNDELIAEFSNMEEIQMFREKFEIHPPNTCD